MRVDGSNVDPDNDLHGVAVTGIVEDTAPLKKVYDPGHSEADAKGYVTKPAPWIRTGSTGGSTS